MAAAVKSLKANNVNLEAISKLGNFIFAGIKFVEIRKPPNFCGKLSALPKSVEIHNIAPLAELSFGIFEEIKLQYEVE